MKIILRKQYGDRTAVCSKYGFGYLRVHNIILPVQHSISSFDDSLMMRHIKSTCF